MTFFVDRSLGGQIVPTALRDAGFEVVAHDDIFTPDTDDQTWLAHVGGHGWIVLMRDDRIRYRDEEREALVAAAVCAFVITDGNATGEELAASSSSEQETSPGSTQNVQARTSSACIATRHSCGGSIQPDAHDADSHGVEGATVEASPELSGSIPTI